MQLTRPQQLQPSYPHERYGCDGFQQTQRPSPPCWRWVRQLWRLEWRCCLHSTTRGITCKYLVMLQFTAFEATTASQTCSVQRKAGNKCPNIYTVGTQQKTPCSEKEGCKQLDGQKTARSTFGSTAYNESWKSSKSWRVSELGTHRHLCHQSICSTPILPNKQIWGTRWNWSPAVGLTPPFRSRKPLQITLFSNSDRFFFPVTWSCNTACNNQKVNSRQQRLHMYVWRLRRHLHSSE